MANKHFGLEGLANRYFGLEGLANGLFSLEGLANRYFGLGYFGDIHFGLEVLANRQHWDHYEFDIEWNFRTKVKKLTMFNPSQPLSAPWPSDVRS